MSHRALLAAILLVATAVPGCGYGLRGNLPGHLQTIAIPVFVNRTSEPAVENIMTRAVVEAFSNNGRLKVTSVDRADAILEGEITAYSVTAIAFDARANVRQYRLVVTMNLLFKDVRRNQVLFDRKGYSEKSDFTLGGAVSETIAREESNTRNAAIEIARTIVNLAVERF